MILSAYVYNDLPEKIAIHWNSSGNPDRFAPKPAAAFGMPLIIAAVNIYVNLRLANDPEKQKSSRITRSFALWSVPAISLVLVPVTLFMSMGVNVPLIMIVSLITGLVFIVNGNYLPKNRQNGFFGYRTPWAKKDADNWNKTQRLAGYLWILSGIIMIVQAFTAFKNAVWLIISVIIWVVLAIVPVFYSYALYKRTPVIEIEEEENK
jgi:uncharacterized membrane protein